ncbi:MAG: tetratricopeptide repeat protein, partial [Terriglobales bacterium]
YWPLERYADRPFLRRWRQLSLEKLPLFLVSAASSVMTVIAQRAGGAVADTSALPFSARLGNAVVSYVAYIGKTVWPARLAAFYPHPEQSLPWSDVVAAAVVLIAITGAAVYFRRARYLLMGWLFFVVTLIPVIGIIQVGRQAMADRYAYVPCIGLFIVVAWGLGEIVEAISLPRALAGAVALAVIMALGAATMHYLSYWQNGVKLYTQASLVAGRPDFMLEELLGDAMVSAGRVGDAFQHYREACELRPNYAQCHYNMAEILFTRQQLREALEQYQLAASLSPSKDIALSCLINSGEILLELGDYQTAEMRLTAALQIDPNNSGALQLRQRALSQESGDHR